jgi:hypothetical protein
MTSLEDETEGSLARRFLTCKGLGAPFRIRAGTDIETAEYAVTAVARGIGQATRLVVVDYTLG